MINIKKIISLTISLCLTAGLLAGCGNGNSSVSETSPDSSDTASSSSSKTQLNVAAELITDNLEPSEGWNSWYTVRWGIGETLVKFNDDYTCEPWLAESWSVADDNLTWTIKLRDDVTFSNGEPMTASKVVASIERLYELEDPANGGEGNPQVYMTYSSITADNEAGTVTIVTEHPTPDLPGCLAYPWMLIIDTEASEGYDKSKEAPIGTGPYVLSSFTQDNNIQLVKNENYWNGEVPFDNVNVMKVSESATRTMALQDKSADMAINISVSDREILQSSGNYDIQSISGARLGYAHINMNGVLGNDTIRQAVMMSIDGQTIADVTTNKSYAYGYSVIPSSLDYGYNELNYEFSYNPDKAKEILDNAEIIDTDGDGYRELDGKNIELNYYIGANRQMDLIGQAQASQLESIGIKCNLQIVDNYSYSDIMMNKSFDLVSSNEVTSPTGDPANFLSHWYSESNSNYSSYKNEEYDKIYEELQVEFDTDKRRDDIIKLQQILLDDSAVLTYGYYNFNICSNDTITGVHCPTSDFYWITTDIKPAE